VRHRRVHVTTRSSCRTTPAVSHEVARAESVEAQDRELARVIRELEADPLDSGQGEERRERERRHAPRVGVRDPAVPAEADPAPTVAGGQPQSLVGSERRQP